MFSIDSIRNEIQKFLKNDYIKSEIKKIKGEIKSLDFYKKLPEPTQKHLNQLEASFQKLSKKITKTQKQVDKEFSGALKSLNKRKDEAAKRIQELRQFTMEQKKTLEDTVSARLKSTKAGASKSSKKATKKVTKKASKKTAAKKRATRKKTAKKTTKTAKTSTRKKTASKKTISN